MKSIPVSHLSVTHNQPGWSSHELAELLRIVKQLTNLGYNIEAGWGTSDEGDPWFAFIDESNNVPLLHITRLNKIYTAILSVHGSSFHSHSLKNLLQGTIQKLTTPFIWEATKP